MNSAIVWRGPSKLDGSEIVVVLTGLEQASGNRKTGDMVQAWILRSDRSPTEAIRDGSDAAICGDCPHRKGSQGRSCYVSLFTGLGSVGRALMRGDYPTIPLDHAAQLLQGRSLRLGAYGDPVAVPVGVWLTLLSYTSQWTGYTHQWRLPQAAEFRGLVMASCDSSTDYTRALQLGWRSFRVRSAGEALEPGEIVCPASHEAGQRVNCADCQLCQGTDKQAKSIAIIAHGAGAKAFTRRQSLNVLAA